MRKPGTIRARLDALEARRDALTDEPRALQVVIVDPVTGALTDAHTGETIADRGALPDAERTIIIKRGD